MILDTKLNIMFNIIWPILCKYEVDINKTLEYYKLIVGDNNVIFVNNNGNVVNDTYNIYETLTQCEIEKLEVIRVLGEVGIYNIGNLKVFKIKNHNDIHVGPIYKAFNTAVNNQITDSVTQPNVKILGNAPAMAMAIIFQTIQNSIDIGENNLQ